jgi:hypothetical protein
MMKSKAENGASVGARGNVPAVLLVVEMGIRLEIYFPGKEGKFQ